MAVGLAEHAWVCACVGTCGSSCAAHTRHTSFLTDSWAPRCGLRRGLRAAAGGEAQPRRRLGALVVRGREWGDDKWDDFKRFVDNSDSIYEIVKDDLLKQLMDDFIDEKKREEEEEEN